jgi:hypothetical protein
MRPRSGKPDPFSIKPPTDEQFWSCLQRLLSFEYPPEKWERISQLLARHVSNPELKPKDIPTLPLSAQDELFSRVFGSETDDNLDTIFSIVLALEEMDRFKPIVFESWANGLATGFANKTVEGWFTKVVPDKSVEQLAKQLGLSAGQLAWVVHCSLAVPDWKRLCSPNLQWSEDPRSSFITTCIKSIGEKTSHQLTVEDIVNARSIFQSLLKEKRNELPGHFLPRVIVMVEGGTESVLLPHFASLLNIDFASLGIMIMPAGGSKQMVRKFLDLRDSTSIGIALIFDADAVEQMELVEDSLRDCDQLHRWNNGEIEDTLPVEILVQQLNSFLHASGNNTYVTTTDFPSDRRRTDVLNQLWRKRGLGDFDKIGFAEAVTNNLVEPSQIPPNVVSVIKSIASLK